MKKSFCTQAATTSLASTLEKCPSIRPVITHMVTKFQVAHQNLKNSYFTYSGVGDVLLWPLLSRNRNDFLVTNFATEEGAETIHKSLEKAFCEGSFQGATVLSNYYNYNVREDSSAILKISQTMVTDVTSIACLISKYYKTSKKELVTTLIIIFDEEVLYNIDEKRLIVVNETAWVRKLNSEFVIGYELTGAFLRNGGRITYAKTVGPLDFCINENFICLIYSNRSLQGRSLSRRRRHYLK